MSRATVVLHVLYDYRGDEAAPLVIDRGTLFGCATRTIRFQAQTETVIMPGELAYITCFADRDGDWGNVPEETIDRPVEPQWLNDMWNDGRVLVAQPDAAFGGSEPALTAEQMTSLYSLYQNHTPVSGHSVTIPAVTYTSVDPGTGTDFTTAVNWRLVYDQNGNVINQIVGRHCTIDESGGYDPEKRPPRPRRPAREEPTLREVWEG